MSNTRHADGMLKEHIAGLLKVDRETGNYQDVVTVDGVDVFTTYTPGGTGLRPIEERFANARRMVACWNSCDGVPTEMLEDVDGLGKATMPYRVMRKQFDALLTDLAEAAATLRRYEALHRAKGTAESTEKAEVNAALAARFEATIAKATGAAS